MTRETDFSCVKKCFREAVFCGEVHDEERRRGDVGWCSSTGLKNAGDDGGVSVQERDHRYREHEVRI
jgi:hypothetical protein